MARREDNGAGRGAAPLACLLLCILWTIPCAAVAGFTAGTRPGRTLLQAGDGGNGTLVFDGADGASVNETAGQLGDGQTLVLEVPSVALEGPLAIGGEDLTLSGRRGGGARTEVTCAAGQPGLVISGKVTIRDLSIIDCTISSSLVLAQSEVVFQNVRFKDNKMADFLPPELEQGFLDFGGSGGGGAIRADVNTTVTVVDSQFIANEASQGGAIYTAGSLFVNGSTFRRNVATASGGGAIKSNADAANLQALQQSQVSPGVASNEFVIRGCVFEKNNAPRGIETEPFFSASGAPIEKNDFFGAFGSPSPSGGAVLVWDVGRVQIEDCSFEKNTATTGGAIYFIVRDLALPIGAQLVHRVENCTFSDNTADLMEGPLDARINHGGAMFVVSLDKEIRPQLVDCQFISNKANYGGALHILTSSQSAMQVSGCEFEANQAETAGGAVLARNIENLAWNASNVIRNEAQMGGGVMITNAASLMVQGVNLDVNATTGTVFIPPGGGTKSVFEGNVAFDGGGLMCYGCDSISIQSAEFRNNRAAGNGGGLSFLDSTPTGAIELGTVTLEGNLATFGGAVFLESASNFRIQAGSGNVQRTLIRGNKAVVGGGLFLALKSVLNNKVEIFDTELSNNSAIRLEQLEDELANDDLFRLANETIRGNVGHDRDSADFFTNCGEGGGGGACIVLSQLPQRAGADVSVLQSVVTNNSALNGGGLFISIHGDTWSSAACTIQGPASVPCRSARFLNVSVTNNFAEFGGGGMFVTEPQSLFATCPGGLALLGLQGSFKSLADVINEVLTASPSDLQNEDFVMENLTCLVLEGNSVGDENGWGKQGASQATALLLLTPESGEIRNHTSNTVLGGGMGVSLAIVDMFGEKVKGGNPDAERPVIAVSVSVTGETIAMAKNGVATFTGLIGFDESGNRSVIFTSESLTSTSMTVEIRSCLVGEEEENEGKGCQRCPNNFYTFKPEQECLQCPEEAICTGGATLAPRDGFWHSTPYSPNILECIVRDACQYRGRASNLTAFYTNLTALMPSNLTLSNEEYPQCAEGYRGVLCGSCQPNYGHIAGGQCEECSMSRASIIGIIFVFAFWSMLLISFEVFNSILTNREMVLGARNTLTAIHVPQRNDSVPTDYTPIQGGKSELVSLFERTSANGGLRRASSEKVVGSFRKPEERLPPIVPLEPRSFQRQSTHLEDFWRRQNNTFLQSLPRGDSSLPDVEVEDMTLSEHIVAAENLTETVKIMTNFLQVTSVAVSVNLGWQRVVEVMLSLQELIAGISNGAKLVPFDCALSDDIATPRSVRALWLRVGFPIMMLAVYWIICFLAWLVVRFKQMDKYRTSRASRKTLFTYIIIVTITLVFFAYNSVTEELMRTVNCINADKEEHTSGKVFAEFVGELDVDYWAEDTALRCFEGDHTLTGIVGAIGLVIFSAGFVAFIIVWLAIHQDKLSQPQFITRYGFIYRAYKTGKVGGMEGAIAREAAIAGRRKKGGGSNALGAGEGPLFTLLKKLPVYWEACITLRKGLISAAVVFAYSLGGNLQGVLALGVLIIALALQLLFRPFRRFPCFNTRRGYSRRQKTLDDYIDLNHLESSSLFVSTVTFYSGIVFNDPNVSTAGTAAMAVFVMTLNVVLLLYFVYRIFEGTHNLVDLKLSDMEVPFSSGSWLVVKFFQLVKAYIIKSVYFGGGQGRSLASSSSRYPRERIRENRICDVQDLSPVSEKSAVHGKMPEEPKGKDLEGSGGVAAGTTSEKATKDTSGTFPEDPPSDPTLVEIESHPVQDLASQERDLEAPPKKILDLTRTSQG